MQPRRPMPDEDTFSTSENPDLDREHDVEEATGDGDGEDEKTPPTIEPDDATPTEDPGISPI